MAKGRISQIMRKTGCRHYVSYLLKIRNLLINIGILLLHKRVKQPSQRTTYRGNLQAVREPIVHKYGSRQRKNLCFILKSAKRGRENQTVIISLKFRTCIQMIMGFTMLVSPPFSRNKLFPVH